jgi:hypothetical protein
MDILGKQVARQLRRDLPHCYIGELSLISDDANFTVLGGAADDDGRILAVKIAHEHVPDASHSTPVNARDILDQEALISTHCRSHGLPSPVVLGKSYHGPADLDFIVVDWPEDDHAMADPFHMGAILNRLHSMNPPAFEPVSMRGEPLEKMLSTTILDRAITITRLTRRDFTLPTSHELLAHLSWPDRRTSLLHMDFGAGTLSSVDGVITGITDWSSALIGPPTLELMNLDEHGVLGDSFLGGYANYEMFRAPPATETAFRLYCATHTAMQFVSDDNDHEQGQKALNRVSFLFDEFARLGT